MLSTVFLCKAACFVATAHGCELSDIPDDLKNRGKGFHAITLNWGPPFAERFTKEEAATVWERFKPLDALLKTDEEAVSTRFSIRSDALLFQRNAR